VFRPGGLRSGRGPDPEAIIPIDPGRVRFGPDRVDVELDGLATSGRFLLLADLLTLHPGWRAEVDGVAAPLRRADGLVTLVGLPDGARRVSFRYRPPMLFAGGVVSCGTLLLLLVGGAIASRGRRAAGAGP